MDGVDLQFRRPVGSTLDVPIERPSVGGMALAAGSQMSRTIKPYRYRGTGVDQMPEADPDWPYKNARPEPKPKPKPRKRRKRKPVGRQPRQRLTVDIADISTWGNGFKPEPECRGGCGDGGVFVDGYCLYCAEALTAPPLPPAKPLRPAKGWQPLSGNDLDAALSEIGENA
jgi:hypothetical protein